MSYRKFIYARTLMQLSVEDMAKHINALRIRNEKGADELVDFIIALCNLRGESNEHTVSN